MALTVGNLLDLKQMKKMELIAGSNGLNNIVVTANLADYEFASDIATNTASLFEAHSFVISSLLYAKDNQGIIYPSIKALYDYKASAFAFKDVIFDTLPPEVIDFANENDFPIFKFSTDTYFENLIFEIMNAVQNDDNHYLQEENISSMISNTMLSSEVLAIAKGLSLKFNHYAACAYVKSKAGDSPLNAEYLHRLFLTSKELRKKAVMATYKGGLHVLMTSGYNNMRSFEILLGEIIEFLSLKESDLNISLSNIHIPYEKLDYCFRESYFCYLASIAAAQSFRNYSAIGVYQLSLPLLGEKKYEEYAHNLLKPFSERPELYETILAWVENGGIISDTASKLNCHINTVRYRLNLVKQLLDMDNKSEYELFANLTPAVHYYQLKKSE